MLLVYQIMLKLEYKNIVSVRFYCLVRRRKIQRKSNRISGTAGLFLLNLVCKVLYMKTLKYVDLVEIGAKVFEL